MNELFLSKQIKTIDLIEFFKSKYEVNASGIFLFEDQDEILDILNHQIGIQVSKLPGDFPMAISIYRSNKFSDIEIARYICKIFDCAVLVSNELTNPYSWKIITLESERVIDINADFLEDYNGFKIVNNTGYNL